MTKGKLRREERGNGRSGAAGIGETWGKKRLGCACCARVRGAIQEPTGDGDTERRGTREEEVGKMNKGVGRAREKD